MKQFLSIVMAAVVLLCCAFSVSGYAVRSEPDDAEPRVHDFCAAAADDADEPEEPARDECTCVCHVFYGVRDSLLEQILDRSVDGKTLLRVLSYYVRLFTWRVLGVHQYCACGARHY